MNGLTEKERQATLLRRRVEIAEPSGSGRGRMGPHPLALNARIATVRTVT
jgi:hypothetical protein